MTVTFCDDKKIVYEISKLVCEIKKRVSGIMIFFEELKKIVCEKS